ncbi:unnamed protein product [Spirodela intermedia]|uniref:TFIIS N-terminal domain-containing protein n=1 Tax=Spirodela intermedia TaxID=51605 RepID=A0A7I8LCU0_SPIIN|nr:unnamed protein product [Spirodela intermedia]
MKRHEACLEAYCGVWKVTFLEAGPNEFLYSIQIKYLLEHSIHIEMRAVLQSGGRSSEPLNGSSTQPLKSGSDSGQNNSTSFPSQTKGKKRGEKGCDQYRESIEHDVSSKAGIRDPGNFNADNELKDEITKLADKGRLINNDAVEKLVQLMQLDKGAREIGLTDRMLLADVIAATDTDDCLSGFVHLRGIPLLDDWLQEAHKGKNGDGSSSKEGSKTVDELLLAILHALDKLPVDLNALQTCNIGKSVNHLRSHKNSEIQKMARNLVDAWKKRVDAEMTKLGMPKLDDTKSAGSSQAVSWSGKQGFSGVSYGGSRRPTSSEVAIENAVPQPSFKSLPVKIGDGDAGVKSNPLPSGSLKFSSTLPAAVSVSTTDSQTETGGSTCTAEIPLTLMKEETNSSNQSLSKSQSCPNNHAKATGSSFNEDARSSATCLVATTKTNGSSPRHPKSSSGFVGSCASGKPLVKSGSLNLSPTPNKESHDGVTVERAIGLPIIEQVSHKGIDKLPIPVLSPAQSVSGSSPEEPSVTGSRVSSTGTSEKRGHVDHEIKVKTDVFQASIAAGFDSESWPNHEMKTTVGSDASGRSPKNLGQAHRMSTDGIGKSVDGLGSVLNESKPGKSFEASFCSINALIESCIKYSETAVSLSVGDDLGMNLLASVATGEISKSDIVFPPRSHGGNSAATNFPCTEDELKLKGPSEDIVTQVPGNPKDNGKVELDEEIKSKGANGEKCSSFSAASCNFETSAKSQSKSNDVAAGVHAEPLLSLPGSADEDESEDHSTNGIHDKRKAIGLLSGGGPLACKKARLSSSDEKEQVCSVNEKMTEGNILLGEGYDAKYFVSAKKKDDEVVEETHSQSLVPIADKQHLPPAMGLYPEDLGHADGAMDAATSAAVCAEVVLKSRKENPSTFLENSQLELRDHEKTDYKGICGPTFVLANSNSPSENSQRKEIAEHDSSVTVNHPTGREPDHERHGKSTEHLSGAEAKETSEVTSSKETSFGHISPAPDNSRRLDFDLNEGLSSDDINTALPVAPAEQEGSSGVHLPHSHPPSGSPVSVTVASPAKGPFVPPNIPLKSTGLPGWKGSAATSAFRPAEPRKFQEMQPSHTAADKQSCSPINLDLNIANASVLEDIKSQSSVPKMGLECGVARMQSYGGLDLDLNRADESGDNEQDPVGTIRRSEATLLPLRSAADLFPGREVSMMRDFDLNDCPSLDEGAERVSQGQHTKSVIPFLPSFGTSSSELGNPSSWFPLSNSYPAVAMPSFMPERGDQSYPVVTIPGTQRMMDRTIGGSAFGGDIYRAPVLSASPSIPYTPAAAAFPYSGFPFTPVFPLPSASFSAGPVAYMHPASGEGPCFPAALPPSARPHLMSLPECGVSGGPFGGQRWGFQGLDLNAGPSNGDMEGKAEKSPPMPRQFYIPGSQASAEEQVRNYQISLGNLKRKDPDGGWDAERLPYRQPSWQ